MKRILAFALAMAMLLTLAACGGNSVDPTVDTPAADAPVEEKPDAAEARDLMDNITARDLELNPDMEAGGIALTQFGVELVKNSIANGENLLISPLSVICALAMTANGAREETLAQMEDVFGLSVEELNAYLRQYVASLPQGENYSLRVANSIWVNDHARFTPRQEFLQTNADYFGADIYTLPFNSAALGAINSWVNDKTEGMIPTILDQIPPEALMYLVNALAFEAKWRTEYNDYQVHERTFTKEDGTEQTVELMYSMENLYLENENATGFIKYYEDRSYAFVGLLPKGGVSIEELIASLSGEELYALLNDAQATMVNVAIPKFETEYSVELTSVLETMGMVNAVDEDLADFSGLGTSTEGNLFISRVLHKTFISVGEQGTKAGAATVVEICDATSAGPTEMKEVHLDRPFVYLLIDCESGVPFFIGITASVEQ